MPYNFDLAKELVEPPVMRAAYSDRTAWLMAVMSALAYVRIEQPTKLPEMAEILSKEKNKRNILAMLQTLLACKDKDKNLTEFESDIDDLGFELVNSYNISIPFVVDTQAFLVKLIRKDRSPMLVLSFRGTEPTKAADIKSDVTLNPVEIGPKDAGHKVHKGFLEGFKFAEKDILRDLENPKLQGIPLYITGHSLGGALAIIATYCISNDSVGACYTFGSPRVGNRAFGQSIKTPIYRVVNAADMVPCMPPSFFIEGLTLFFRWIPGIPYHNKIADFFDKFRHARHYGDLRYLYGTKRIPPESDGELATYPKLEVISNPPQISRWFWRGHRILTNWKAGFQDHSIDNYVEKLAHWGMYRISPDALPLQEVNLSHADTDSVDSPSP